jgi:hypothetical protein
MTVYRALAVFTVEVVGCACASFKGGRGVGRQGNELLDALVTLVITLNVPFKVQFVHVFATQTTCHFLPWNQQR